MAATVAVSTMVAIAVLKPSTEAQSKPNSGLYSVHFT